MQKSNGQILQFRGTSQIRLVLSLFAVVAAAGMSAPSASAQEAASSVTKAKKQGPGDQLPFYARPTFAKRFQTYASSTLGPIKMEESCLAGRSARQTTCLLSGDRAGARMGNDLRRTSPSTSSMAEQIWYYPKLFVTTHCTIPVCARESGREQNTRCFQASPHGEALTVIACSRYRRWRRRMRARLRRWRGIRRGMARRMRFALGTTIW